jgi:hypothetical protein
MNKPLFIVEHGTILVLLLLLCATQPALTYPALAAADTTIYSDTLASGWLNWSWETTLNFDNSQPVHSGSASIAITYNTGYAGLYLHTDTAISANEYSAIQFWVHGGSTGGQSVNLNLNDSNGGYPFTVQANTWTQVTVPLFVLDNPTTLTDLVWQEASGHAQPTFYLDDIGLIRRSSPNGWLVLDGTDKFATAPYQSELDLRGGSFTVEMWVKFTDDILSQDAYEIYPLQQVHSFLFRNEREWVYDSFRYCNSLFLYNNVWGCTYYGGDTGTLLGTNGGHLAGVYDQAAGETRFYWNGQLLSTNSQAQSTETPGGFLVNLGGFNIIKYADEIRISDIVRYSDSFDIPSSAFTCDANTRALWHFDELEGSTVFHDACGTQDNFLTGYNGAHTEGVTGHWVYLPLAIRTH